MSLRRHFASSVTVITFAACTFSLLSISGCPVPQQTVAPPASGGSQDSGTDDSSGGQGGGGGTPVVIRPVPPVSSDDSLSQPGGAGGGRSPIIDSGAGQTPSGGGGAGGGGQTPGQPVTIPITIVISNPQTFDIFVLPGQPARVAYEVLGGNPVTGTTTTVNLLADRDGRAGTGDEIAIATGLPLTAPGGLDFVPNLPAGVYFLGIQASDRPGSVATEFARGKLIVVGAPNAQLLQPTNDLLVRNDANVVVSFKILSLSESVEWQLLLDRDTTPNGNEIVTPVQATQTPLQAGELTITRTLTLSGLGLTRGDYFFALRIRDRQSQDRIVHLALPVGGFRRITIDESPILQVNTPVSAVIFTPGTTIPIQVRAGDPEGAGTVRVFIDNDRFVNGGEIEIANFAMTSTPQDQTIDLDIGALSPALAPGTYNIGATARDSLSPQLPAVNAYAPGSVRVNGPPTVTILAPLTDVTQTSAAGTAIQIRWSVSDLPPQFQFVRILRALDQAPADGVPDGPWIEVQRFTGAAAAVTSSFSLSTELLAGRNLIAVEAVDDLGLATLQIAPGRVTVTNLPPTVTFDPPLTLAGVRGSENVPIRFRVNDPEGRLAAQGGANPGIELFVAAPGAETVPLFPPLSELVWGPGRSNVGLIDTALLAPFLVDGNGSFVIVVKAQDFAGNVTRAQFPTRLEVDSQIPEITIIEPAFQPGVLSRDHQGLLNFRVRVRDTSNTRITIALDRDFNPLEGTDEVVVALNENVGTGGGTTEVEYTASLDLAERIPASIDPTTPFRVPTGLYYIFVRVEDAVLPGISLYGPDDPTPSIPDDQTRIRIRDRLIGTIAVSSFDNSVDGAVLRGFNVNDMAGSSAARFPDVDNDGRDEFMLVSRYGKAYVGLLSMPGNTYGFGEAYMIYGGEQRLRGVQSLNAVGRGSIPGLILPGIRSPLLGPDGAAGARWVGTDGIADVTVINDMDGDNLPEMVFSFPRVESVSLQVEGQQFPQVQLPQLNPDIGGMGNLEYSAWNPASPPIPTNPSAGTWNVNKAQFTRGGVVIVSSHNRIIRNRLLTNRRSDRVLDLHEVGQLFSGMSRAQLKQYIREGERLQPEIAVCGTAENPTETDVFNYQLAWDVVFENQAPGGFHMPWTDLPADPPLCNPTVWNPNVLKAPPDAFGPNDTVPALGAGDPPAWPCGPSTGTPPVSAPPEDRCRHRSGWYDWTRGGMQPFPCQALTFTGALPQSWNTQLNIDNFPPMTSDAFWSGFYEGFIPPSGSTPVPGETTGSIQVQILEDAIGARVLGEHRESRFGTSVASDNTWLYVSSPDYNGQTKFVPQLLSSSAGGDRTNAGVIFQLRVDVRNQPGQPNRAQLWMERNPDAPILYPNTDLELPGRNDYTMPIPHQYIIETCGSSRNVQLFPVGDLTTGEQDGCVPSWIAGRGTPADRCPLGTYPVDTAGFLIRDTPQQIVGPHINSRIRYVRALADFNGDGLRDFAVGSETLRENFNNPSPSASGGPLNPSGATVGGVFIIYSRPTGVAGDYLLERIAYDPASPERLNGVLIKGLSGASIGRSFGNAGDFNGDGVDDVAIGSPSTAGNAGEVVILLGSRSETLLSPTGGWTFDTDIPNRSVRFRGPAGSRAGFNVSPAGDVDGDGFGDLLVAAPGAADPRDPATPGFVAGNPGVVYLIYGSVLYGSTPEASGTAATPLNLSDVGTERVPGVVLVGRRTGDELGGGSIPVTDVDPAGTDINVVSEGLSAIGDVDGDGLDDIVISATKASPNSRTRAGEVIVIYGKGDLIGAP